MEDDVIIKLLSEDPSNYEDAYVIRNRVFPILDSLMKISGRNVPASRNIWC
jgi:hypothetical protein